MRDYHERGGKYRADLTGAPRRSVEVMHVSLSGPPIEEDLDLPSTVEEALARYWALPESARQLWELLATLGTHDLAIARAVEPHLDALGILQQAGFSSPAGCWGVFAAEGGDDPLLFDGATLAGTKPWCSLAGQLDHALVTAQLPSGERALFTVDLHHAGVEVVGEAWKARGLTEIPSGPVRFHDVPAAQVGEAGWYLDRPGFAWGGIAVAACWYGGAIGVARAVLAAKPSPYLVMHLGAIDVALGSARRALLEASALDGDPRITAKRVRGTVARACEEVLWRAAHALGPAPLALDETHAKRVADLQLYIRQHHAEKDDASLGEALLGSTPW
jgi:hypothetical protein